MEVVRKGVLPDGSAIQIEDWSKAYPGTFKYASTVAAYPVCKYTLDGQFAPKAGERFRAQFDFPSYVEAQTVFDALINGNKQLSDFADSLWFRRYAPCLTGKPSKTSQ